MERKITFSVGEYYHIYNRGNDKRIIFIDNTDYLRFLTLLYISNNTEAVHISNLVNQGDSLVKIMKMQREDTLVDIGAYCLLPNHFHLLVKEKKENGITKFMGKMSTGYSMYFNKKNERTGKLFEGTFKSVHADVDVYLKYLFSYIHLNPIKIIDPNWKEEGIKDKNKAKEFLREYVFSSYMDYLGADRPESGIINKQAFPDYFSTQQDFNYTINDWLSFKNTTIKATP